MRSSEQDQNKTLPQKTLLDYTPEQWATLAKEIGNQIRDYTKLKGAQSKTLAWPVYVIIAIVFIGVVSLAAIGIIDGQSVRS